jgi:hypothetical protein
MRRRTALLAAAGLLVAGCATVPGSGPIVEMDQPVTEAQSGSFVRVLARPPQPGMSPVEIVQGFLDAASGFEDGHDVARQYLTRDAASKWDPGAGVTVYGNDSEELAQQDPATVVMRATQAGVITVGSEFVPADREAQLSQEFTLEQVDGQWRISGAPDGLLLSRAAVERSYEEWQTYFVAEPGGILAPNTLLFTRSQADVTEDLIRALLAGPGDWLAPAVGTGFPAGTGLNAVSTADGVVTVDLTAEAGSADEVSRQQLSAQMVWTLRQLTGVTGVLITVEGQPLEVPGVPEVQPRTAWAQFDPDGVPPDARAYFVQSGAVRSLDAVNTVSAVPGPAGTADPAVTDPLVNPTQTSVAATTRDGDMLTSGLQDQGQWIGLPGPGTAGGSWDRTGRIWIPDERTGGIRIATVLGTQPVETPPGRVRSVQISRDGSRALVVAGPRDGAAAQLMVVDRSTSPPSLIAPRALLTPPVRAAAWSSPTQVALLVQMGDDPASVATVDLGTYEVGFLGGPPRADSVAAAPSRPLLSGTRDGQIWQFNGTAWIPVTSGRAPRYPG